MTSSAMFDSIEPSSEALAAAVALTRDNLAFEMLYQRYNDALYRWIFARTSRHPQLAEDITGELWVRVTRNIEGFVDRGEGSFAGWLFQIARNLLADEYRKAKHAPVLNREDLALAQPSMDLSPAEAAEQQEMAHTMIASLRRLNSAQRTCLVLRFYHGLSVAETAAVMGKSPDSVKQLTFRALRSVKRTLPEAVTLSEQADDTLVLGAGDSDRPNTGSSATPEVEAP